MAKTILLKSIVSEKAELLSEKQIPQYTFVVNSSCNKIEVRNAIEARYGVTVQSINTMNMPGKSKNRSTKSGVIKGRVAGYKKAMVTLIEGDTLDLYNEL